MRGFPAVFSAAACLWAIPVAAQTAPAEQAPEIIVYGRALQQIGRATSGSEGVVGFADFEDRPISRVGELAENVPGLIATQHSGSGKANQYFLRGFNLDHGTDLAGFVDGAPINMRTHGHGQGYLDLNFLIPELVERIDYTKGPYHAEIGDFGSAGSLSFRTKSALERPIVEATVGSFGYLRELAAGSGALGQGTLLAAVDITRSDGPWVLSERLHKSSAFAKYTIANWSVGLSAYDSSWQSTDQVPLRAITSGLIPRNGYIDPDLGGRSGRIALTVNGMVGDTAVNFYAIGSRLQLTSNFTYFLDDPAQGDEFRQVDRRAVFGGALRHRWDADIFSIPTHLSVGVDARYDRIGLVGLYRTVAGQIASTVRQDKADEYGSGLYAEAEGQLTPHLRLALGLRGDVIGYRVRSDRTANSGSGSATILTPKAALAWRVEPDLEFYADYGEGYHSNDVRGATISVDPASGDPVGRVPVFARSRGAELGVRLEHGPLTASLVGFWLDLASELVFVGDAGATEPNPASRRFGGELALFWRPTPTITIDGQLAITDARFRDVAADADRIPGAVPAVAAGGISARLVRNMTVTARVRHFGGAPLIEDGSQRSRGTTLVNAGIYLERGRMRFSVDLLNLFDAHDADITYFYASRLPGEPADGVGDDHLHPVEPRQVRVAVRYAF